MSAKEDLRIIKTRHNIENAFISLLEKAPFEKITVKQILEEALISKGTFYAHYLDKYDLAEKIVDTALQEFRMGMKERLALLRSGEHDELGMSLQKTIQTILPRLILLKKIHTDRIDVDSSIKTIVNEEYLTFQQSLGRMEEHSALKAHIATNFVMGFVDWQVEHTQQITMRDYIDEIHKFSAEYGKWLRCTTLEKEDK